MGGFPKVLCSQHPRSIHRVGLRKGRPTADVFPPLTFPQVPFGSCCASHTGSHRVCIKFAYLPRWFFWSCHAGQGTNDELLVFMFVRAVPPYLILVAFYSWNTALQHCEGSYSVGGVVSATKPGNSSSRIRLTISTDELGCLCIVVNRGDDDPSRD